MNYVVVLICDRPMVRRRKSADRHCEDCWKVNLLRERHDDLSQARH